MNQSKNKHKQKQTKLNKLNPKRAELVLTAYLLHFFAAEGTTAAPNRASRIELWDDHPRLHPLFVYRIYRSANYQLNHGAQQDKDHRRS
jgi:hypothetical protein